MKSYTLVIVSTNHSEKYVRKLYGSERRVRSVFTKLQRLYNSKDKREDKDTVVTGMEICIRSAVL